MDILPDYTKGVLAGARDKYGNKNEILVAIEELNELACVLAKYPRYEEHDTAVTELREKALGELGDVFNAIEHIQAIFGIEDREIVEMAIRKGERLSRWLQKDGGVEVTTLDREVLEHLCENCKYRGLRWYEKPCISCNIGGLYSGFVARD